MNARTYNLNKEAAIESENTSGNFINQSGKYKGKFTRAESITSTKGTEGIEFAFLSDKDQEADFLTIWTFNADGKELFGFKQLNAIMACLRVGSMSPKEMTVEKYDFDKKEKVKVKATVFSELMNKPIGLILRQEEYINGKGEVKTKMSILNSFSADTEQTAGELIAKSGESKQVASIIQWLSENPIKKVSSAPQSVQGKTFDEAMNEFDVNNGDIDF